MDRCRVTLERGGESADGFADVEWSQSEEFETDRPGGGHIEGLTLRLYDGKTRQWNIHWATSKGGRSAHIGEFKNGRGEFYDTEPSGPDGRNILVRYIDQTRIPD